MKAPAHLERLGRLKTVCVDKTGTLTEGAFALADARLATAKGGGGQAAAGARRRRDAPVGVRDRVPGLTPSRERDPCGVWVLPFASPRNSVK